MSGRYADGRKDTPAILSAETEAVPETSKLAETEAAVRVTREGREKVGLAETPSPLDTVIWLVVPVRVRPTKVLSDVCTRMPLVLYAARAVRPASRG